MSAVGKFRAGKNARVSVAGVNLALAEWELERTGDDLDTTNFESAGEDQGTIGITGSTFSVRGNWNAGANAYDAPPGLYPRDDLANVLLYENVADNVGHSIPVARVLSARNGAQVRGLVTFEASGKSNGGITLATGSV